MTSFSLLVNVSIFVFLVSVFLLSAYHKIQASQSFYEALLAFRVVPVSFALPLSKMIPWLEGAVVVLSIITALFFSVLYSGVLLLAVLSLYTAILFSAKVRNLTLDDCGCSFTQSKSEVSINLLMVRNSLLLAGALLLCINPQELTQAPLLVWCVGVVFSGFLVVSYFSFDLLISNYSLLKKLRV
ncbi:MauE/DoxX family redox-associated membrane protein [Sessilibacter corallicola]|uniref:MauE/DoxX family redox-associated membrane protein n=1 Tax=Sessilibacter corallicola TaxID=2904075 RepID=UPI001E619989|nr:hypothetical protein [Sessilibacter corallicola]